jgi:hypothetical protein
VREVLASVRGKDSIVREYPGVMVFLFNGNTYWAVYPEFGGEVEFPEHKEI